MKWLFDEKINQQLNPDAQCDVFSSNFGHGDALHFQYTFIIVGICIILLYFIFAILAKKYGDDYDWLKILDLRNVIDVPERVYQQARRKCDLEGQHILIYLMYFIPPIITLGIIQSTTFNIGFASVFILSAIFFLIDPGVHYAHNLGNKTEFPKTVKQHANVDTSDFHYDPVHYWDKEVPNKDEPNRYKEVKIMHARNVYQGSSSFTIVIAIFAAQVSLTLFYCAAVWEGGKPCFEESRQFFFYYMGNFVKGVCFLIMQDTVTDANLENDRFYWRYTLLAVQKKNTISVTKCGDRKMKMTSELQWKARHWMSVFVNGYLKLTVFFLMSIQVSQSPNSMDFVLNIIAAIFIFELDDHSTWGANPAMIKLESNEKEYDTSSSSQQVKGETNIVEEMKRIATEIDEKIKEWRMLEEKQNSLILRMDSSAALSVSAAIDSDNQSHIDVESQSKK